jgi:hypothetical protein
MACMCISLLKEQGDTNALAGTFSEVVPNRETRKIQLIQEVGSDRADVRQLGQSFNMVGEVRHRGLRHGEIAP